MYLSSVCVFDCVCVCVCVCVCFMSWYLCEILQLSTPPRIRNQTQSHLTSCGCWSVTENTNVHTHTHAHILTRVQAQEEQSNRTHTLPQASREEGSKGWWSQSTPTVNLPVRHYKLPFSSVTSRMNRHCNE